jgi:hypothetical protein
VAELRAELAALRRGVGAGGPGERALALLPAWISAVGVTCCVGMIALSLQALRERR